MGYHQNSSPATTVLQHALMGPIHPNPHEEKGGIMRSKKSMFVSAAGLIMAVGMISAPSASASISQTQPAADPSGTLYMWEDPDYTGGLYVETGPDECPPSGCDIDGWDGDNEISSAKNLTNCTARVYDNDGFTGGYIDLLPGRYYPNLERQGFDNKAESYRFFGCG